MSSDSAAGSSRVTVGQVSPNAEEAADSQELTMTIFGPLEMGEPLNESVHEAVSKLINDYRKFTEEHLQYSSSPLPGDKPEPKAIP